MKQQQYDKGRPGAQPGRKKGRKKKKYKNDFIFIVVLAVIAAVLAVSIYFIRGSIVGQTPSGTGTNGTQQGSQGGGSSGSGGGSGSGAGSGAGGGGSSNGSSGGGAIDNPAGADGISGLWYYEPARAVRYEAFGRANPHLTDEEVCWMVGCDLDLTPYVDISPIPDPGTFLVNVNKFYYLPEDYQPADLVYIGKSMMRTEAGEAMFAMIDAAASEGHTLWVQSGIRSYSIQEKLFNDYSARDGVEAAETYSARPGHSEHQTGLTADLNTITDAFGLSPEGIWAAENCWRFGFIVRYTKENTDITLYKPEPWHMRYVGREAAGFIRDEQIIAYEEYWVKYVKHKP